MLADCVSLASLQSCLSESNGWWALASRRARAKVNPFSDQRGDASSQAPRATSQAPVICSSARQEQAGRRDVDKRVGGTSSEHEHEQGHGLVRRDTKPQCVSLA